MRNKTILLLAMLIAFFIFFCCMAGESTANVCESLETQEKAGETQISCRVTNELDWPKIISIEMDDMGSTRIEWIPVEKADGYVVYRSSDGTSWESFVQDEKECEFTDKVDRNTVTYYNVRAFEVREGQKYFGKFDNEGISTELGNSGQNIINIKKQYLGDSGEKRKIYSYSIGNGRNHIVLTFAVHGWDDNWERDGEILVKTGEQLFLEFSENVDLLKENDFCVSAILISNPDGLYSGNSCNGPGRCTTCRFDEDGKIQAGGVDLNRCFPVDFKSSTAKRNYTGSQPLMCAEAKIIKEYLDSNLGKGKNYYIDVHGWSNQIFTRISGKDFLYDIFMKSFAEAEAATWGFGNGFIVAYADSIKYDACLFEFPDVKTEKEFYKRKLSDSFIRSIFRIVDSDKDSKSK
ncbi:MAG: hypothetical protein MR966_07995 [Lachnospiraceae bacterium]|nr:hypothetical protein [Lachnospiraceae bacterium]